MSKTKDQATQTELAIEEMLSEVQRGKQAETLSLIEKLKNGLAGGAAPVEENRVEVTAPDNGEAGPVQRVQTVMTRQPVHPLYASLHRQRPETKDYRTPEADYWSAQWIQGVAEGNIARQKLAHAKITDLGYGRATWDEGTASATGGIASGEGADLIPVPLLGVIMIERDKVAKIPGLSTPIQLTAQQARIPRAGSFTVAMVAEGSTATAGEPTLDTVLPVAHKMQGKALATNEMLADSAFNTVGIFATRAGMSMGALEDVQACTTDGTPPNISEAIAPTRGAAAGATLDYADVVTVYFGVEQQYRMDGVWYGNSAGLEALTKVNSAVGYPVFSQQAGVPGAIVDDSADGFVFRKPVYEVPLVSATTVNGDGVLGFMSRAGYGWGRRMGITASASEAAGFDTDTTHFKFTQRVDGVNLDVAGRSFIEDFA